MYLVLLRSDFDDSYKPVFTEELSTVASCLKRKDTNVYKLDLLTQVTDVNITEITNKE